MDIYLKCIHERDVVANSKLSFSRDGNQIRRLCNVEAFYLSKY